MGDMAYFLGMLGVLVGGVVVYIIWGNISAALFKGKSIVGKAEALMKKDLSSQCAECTFYLFHNYDIGFSQSEWKTLYETFQKRTQEMDKDSEEYAKLAAPFINAIVIDGNYYVRRGMQDMNHSGEHFIRGVNDRISLNYYVEPYEYVKDEKAATKYEQAKAKYEMESAELRAAQRNYEMVCREYDKHKGTRSESFYAAKMQEAHAAMLSAQIKYDNRK